MILLAFFDGIGSAAVCLQALGVQPILYLSWELDPDCKRIVSHWFPSVRHCGDACQVQLEDVHKAVLEVDPDGKALILCCAGPPCPDFSMIRSDAPGKAGPEGRKFTEYCAQTKSLEDLLQPRHFVHLCENVIFAQPSEADHFSNELKANPIALDAADFGLISRPRLFWTRIQWSEVHTNPITQEPLKWGKIHRFPRLFIEAPFTEESHLDIPSEWHLHPSVSSHVKCIPCLTTPSPDGAGRAPPKKTKGKIDEQTRHRWLNDSRTYAPWQYRDAAMLHHHHHEPRVLPIEVKEQLHGFSANFTGVAGASERARHRMLANSWRLGVVQFLLVILFSLLQPSHSAPIASPTQSALQFCFQLARAEHHCMGPIPWGSDEALLRPASDEWDHWLASHELVHPNFATPQVEPGAEQTIQKLLHTIGDVARLRHEVITEMQELVQSWTSHTTSWMKEIPEHVLRVYRSSAIVLAPVEHVWVS